MASLALVFHSVVLTRFDYWGQPIGWLLAALMLGGSAAAVLVLLGRVGAGRQVGGTVETLVHHPGLDVIESRIALQPGGSGHAAGQFAFVTADAREGAHPYTIASAWDSKERRITFITKALGNHARRLREHLRVGLPVTVERPCGCFDCEDSRPRQIWIGASRHHALRGPHEACWQPCRARRRSTCSTRQRCTNRRPSRSSKPPRGGAGLGRGQPVVLRARGLRPGPARGLHRPEPAQHAPPPGTVEMR